MAQRPHVDYSTTWTYVGQNFYQLIRTKLLFADFHADDENIADQLVNDQHFHLMKDYVKHHTPSKHRRNNDYDMRFRIIEPQIVSLNPTQKLYLLRIIVLAPSPTSFSTMFSSSSDGKMGPFPNPIDTPEWFNEYVTHTSFIKWRAVSIYVLILETMRRGAPVLNFVNLITETEEPVILRQTSKQVFRLIQVSPNKVCLLKTYVSDRGKGMKEIQKNGADYYYPDGVQHDDYLIGYLLRLKPSNLIYTANILVERIGKHSLFPEIVNTLFPLEEKYLGYLSYATTKEETSLTFCMPGSPHPYEFRDREGINAVNVVNVFGLAINTPATYGDFDFAVLRNNEVLYRILFHDQNDNYFNLKVTHLIEIQSANRNRIWVGIGMINVLDLQRDNSDLAVDIQNRQRNFRMTFFEKLEQKIKQYEEQNDGIYTPTKVTFPWSIELRSVTGDPIKVHDGHGDQVFYYCLPVFVKLVWVPNTTDSADIRNGTFQLLTSKPFLPIWRKSTTVPLGNPGDYLSPYVHPMHSDNDRTEGFIFSYLNSTGMTLIQENTQSIDNPITQDNRLLMSFDAGKFYSLTLDFLIRDIIEMCNHDVTTTDFSSLGLGIFPVGHYSNIRYAGISSKLYVIQKGPLQDKLISIDDKFKISVLDKETMKPLSGHDLTLEKLQDLCFTS